MKSAIEGDKLVGAEREAVRLYSDYVHTDRLGSVMKPGGLGAGATSNGGQGRARCIGPTLSARTRTREN